MTALVDSTSTARSPIVYDHEGLRRIAATISQALGIKMPEEKLTMLQNRLQRRLGELGLLSLDAYERMLRDPVHAAAERTQLYDLATTNKTDFFREPAHFVHLTDTILPAREDRGRFRVWCAGCSSGQEAYTLAMVLADHAASHPGFDFEIVGTDVSTRMLRAAAGATYPSALAAPIPPLLRQRYLMTGRGSRSGSVRIVPELRAKISLRHLNFMDERYGLDTFDVVFFRNVLIYFDRPTQQQVLTRMCRHLRPGGHLFISHTESLAQLDLPLVAETHSILRRRA